MLVHVFDVALEYDYDESMNTGVSQETWLATNRKLIALFAPDASLQAIEAAGEHMLLLPNMSSWWLSLQL